MCVSYLSTCRNLISSLSFSFADRMSGVDFHGKYCTCNICQVAKNTVSHKRVGAQSCPLLGSVGGLFVVCVCVCLCTED